MAPASLIRADKTTHTPYPPGLRDIGGRGLQVCLAGSDQIERTMLGVNSVGGVECLSSAHKSLSLSSVSLNNTWWWHTAGFQALARLVGITLTIIYLPLPSPSVYGCLGGTVVKDLPDYSPSFRLTGGYYAAPSGDR
jgi:hypothetical protein